ncbi:MAG: ribbon-helix-helix protein, CopG family [Deltaproteobacteria bacterium]|nr:ribbon-helix-helix protein, CopG family [Deltaproteobacteria bacterium]
MDKVLSERVDESTVRRIRLLARRLDTSKKKIIESAIQMYASKIEEEQNLDVLDQTFGAWHREESVDQLSQEVRKVFRSSMMRHQK